jgi:hypothetical protein
MEINFKGTVYIREEDVEDMARLVINGGYGIDDAINEVLAYYDDDVYCAREYFWDELVEQVRVKMKEVKPKKRTVRFTAYIDLPIRNEDEFYNLLSQEKIDFNDCEDVEFEEIIDED